MSNDTRTQEQKKAEWVRLARLSLSLRRGTAAQRSAALATQAAWEIAFPGVNLMTKLLGILGKFFMNPHCAICGREVHYTVLLCGDCHFAIFEERQ